MWWRARTVALPLVLGVVLLAAWDWGVRALGVSPLLLPRPAPVVAVVVDNFGLMREHVAASLYDIVWALIFSSLLGISIALLLSSSRLVHAALMPNLVALELVPKIALAPLFIIWLGTGSESRLAFAFFLAFFPIVVAATAGLVNTDPALIRLCRAARATPLQTLLRVRLPYALPLVFSGMKIGSTMAVIGVIVGEFITGNKGIGYLIMYGASNMETALMLGSVLVLCGLGALVYATVAVLERLVTLKYGRPLS